MPLGAVQDGGERVKTVILTIKPRHLKNILSGKKEIEIRKSRPQETPFLVLMCESGSGGTIKGQFWCDKITTIWPDEFSAKIFSDKACISNDEIQGYASGKMLYAWKVSDVVDYSKMWPYKNISEFGIERPPQSWCYAKEART